MNQSENTSKDVLRGRLQTAPAYWPSVEKREFAAKAKLKVNAYERQGHVIFAVTLSTFLSSEKIAKSDWMRHFWEHEFLYRVQEQLPRALKNKIDYDYTIEKSPAGHFHYHGVLAMPRDAADRIWKDGVLKPALDRDLKALREKGQYRTFAVNSFLLEPIRADQTVDRWINYMTKTHDYISSAGW